MQVGECPLWDPAEAALYRVDIEGFAVHRLHLASGRHRAWHMPAEPSALARNAGGGLIVALRSGLAHLNTQRQPDAEPAYLAQSGRAAFGRNASRPALDPPGKLSAAGRRLATP